MTLTFIQYVGSWILQIVSLGRTFDQNFMKTLPGVKKIWSRHKLKAQTHDLQLWPWTWVELSVLHNNFKKKKKKKKDVSPGHGVKRCAFGELHKFHVKWPRNVRFCFSKQSEYRWVLTVHRYLPTCFYTRMKRNLYKVSSKQARNTSHNNSISPTDI